MQNGSQKVLVVLRTLDRLAQSVWDLPYTGKQLMLFNFTLWGLNRAEELLPSQGVVRAGRYRTEEYKVGELCTARTLYKV